MIMGTKFMSVRQKQPRKRRASRVGAGFESLEDRRLLAYGLPSDAISLTLFDAPVVVNQASVSDAGGQLVLTSGSNAVLRTENVVMLRTATNVSGNMTVDFNAALTGGRSNFFSFQLRNDSESYFMIVDIGLDGNGSLTTTAELHTGVTALVSNTLTFANNADHEFFIRQEEVGYSLLIDGNVLAKINEPIADDADLLMSVYTTDGTANAEINVLHGVFSESDGVLDLESDPETTIDSIVHSIEYFPAPASIVSRWPLTETSGVREDVVGGNDLQDNSAVGAGDGYANLPAGVDFIMAADFERDDGTFLSIADASQAGLDVTGALTVSAWFKPESLSDNRHHVLVSKYWPTAHNVSYRLSVRGDQKLNLVIAETGDATLLREVIASTSLVVDTWQHAVGVFEPGQSMKLYLNGIVDGSETEAIPSSIANKDAMFVLGATEEGREGHADGSMNDVIIWNRALTAGEVSQLYDAYTLPDTTPPETTIVSTPPDPSVSDAADFEFISNEPSSTFECSLDGDAFVACISPQSYNALNDGSHIFQVRATDLAGNTDATPDSFSWTVVTTVPSVEQMVVNNGSEQRSMVRSLEVTFNREVTLDVGAFTVQQVDGQEADMSVSDTVVDGKTVATLTFNNGSLVDGNYALIVHRNRVQNGPLVMAADYVDTFLKHFGDSDGDREVSFRDFAFFRRTFGRQSSDPGFNDAFDSDNDGNVNFRDFAFFRQRFTKKLVAQPFLHIDAVDGEVNPGRTFSITGRHFATENPACITVDLNLVQGNTTQQVASLATSSTDGSFIVDVTIPTTLPGGSTLQATHNGEVLASENVTVLHSKSTIIDLFSQVFERQPNATNLLYWRNRTDKAGPALVEAMQFAHEPIIEVAAADLAEVYDILTGGLERIPLVEVTTYTTESVALPDPVTPSLGQVETESFNERTTRGIGPNDTILGTGTTYYDDDRGVDVYAGDNQYFVEYTNGAVELRVIPSDLPPGQQHPYKHEIEPGTRDIPDLGQVAKPVARTGKTFFDAERGIDVHASDGHYLIEYEDRTVEERVLPEGGFVPRPEDFTIGGSDNSQSKSAYGPSKEELGLIDSNSNPKPSSELVLIGTRYVSSSGQLRVASDGNVFLQDPVTGTILLRPAADAALAQLKSPQEIVTVTQHDADDVTSLFQQAFGRTPTVSELDYWRLRTDKSGAALLGAMEFAHTQAVDEAVFGIVGAEPITMLSKPQLSPTLHFPNELVAHTPQGFDDTDPYNLTEHDTVFTALLDGVEAFLKQAGSSSATFLGDLTLAYDVALAFQGGDVSDSTAAVLIGGIEFAYLNYLVRPLAISGCVPTTGLAAPVCVGIVVGLVSATTDDDWEVIEQATSRGLDNAAAWLARQAEKIVDRI